LYAHMNNKRKKKKEKRNRSFDIITDEAFWHWDVSTLCQIVNWEVTRVHNISSRKKFECDIIEN
jgi:hypothetical protein